MSMLNPIQLKDWSVPRAPNRRRTVLLIARIQVTLQVTRENMNYRTDDE
jgi:hypothetical protein